MRIHSFVETSSVAFLSVINQYLFFVKEQPFCFVVMIQQYIDCDDTVIIHYSSNIFLCCIWCTCTSIMQLSLQLAIEIGWNASKLFNSHGVIAIAVCLLRYEVIETQLDKQLALLKTNFSGFKQSIL